MAQEFNKEKLTWDDLYYLWDKHNLSVGEIHGIPGYENFEITGKLGDKAEDEEEFEEADDDDDETG